MASNEISYEPGGSRVQEKSIKSSLLTMTVEPLILFYILPSTMNYLVTQNLLLEKSCRVNLAYNDSVCDAIMKGEDSGYNHQEKAVHQLAAKMITVKAFIHGILPVILMLFLGSWSDKHGKRKPCILGPIIGELVAVPCLILNSIFLYEIPVIVTSLAQSLPMALSGGWPCLFLGAYSYVTTLSSESNLTTKIGGVTTVQKIAMVIGLGCGGIMLNYFGFIGSYSTIFFMMLSSLIYGYYIIKERRYILSDIEEEIESLEKTPKMLIKDFFKIEHFLSTIQVCFLDWKVNQRFRIIAILVLLIITNGPMQGEQSVIYLYAKLQLGWSEIDFSTFYALQLVIQIFGTLIALTLFSRYFKWQDETLGIIAFVSSASAGATFAFATEGKSFYIGAVLDLFNGVSDIVLRSIMLKIVPMQERGKMNSVFGICESLTHLGFGILYATLYRYSLHIFPGTVFLVSSALKCFGLLILAWLFCQISKDRTHNEVNT